LVADAEENPQVLQMWRPLSLWKKTKLGWA